MRTPLAALLTLAALVLVTPITARAAAIDEITTANQKGQVVFLVLTQTGTRNVEAARSAAKEAQKQVKGSVVVELNRSDATQAAAVKRYRLQAAPTPLVLVIASNGVAVGASRAGKGAVARLVKLVPTPKKADVMQAFEQKQIAIIVFSKTTMPERGPLFENLSAVSREMKDKIRLVLVDIDDASERKFVDEWAVPMASRRPTVAVVNPKGQPLGRLVGAPTAAEIIKTCKKRAACCTDPTCKGCKDKAK